MGTEKIIKALLVLSLLVWPFGLLLSYQSPFLPFPIYLLDLLVIMLSLLVTPHLVRCPVGKSLLYFYLIILISLLFNYSRVSLSALAYTLRLFAYPSIYFLAQRHQYLVKKYLPISIAIFLVIGLTQYFFFPDMRYLKNLGFDDHYYRLISSFYDPNFTGAIFAATSLYFFAKSKHLFGALSLTALALTFSRASYFGFIVGLLFYILNTKKIKFLYLLVAIVTLILVIPKPFGEGVNLWRTFSIFSRLGNWETNLSLFLQRPLLGWGYGTLRSVDSSPIMMLVSSGLLGFGIFISLLYKMFVRTTILGQAFFLVILSHSLFNNSLFFIWIYFLFFLVSRLETKECS